MEKESMASLIRGEREDDLALFHGMQRRDHRPVIHSDINHNHNSTDPYLNSGKALFLILSKIFRTKIQIVNECRLTCGSIGRGQKKLAFPPWF